MNSKEIRIGVPVTSSKWLAVAFLVVSLLDAASCSSSKPGTHSTTTLAPPRYTSSQQSLYFHDVYRNVPSAISYVAEKGKSGDVALLAYGAGFCKFLRAGQDPATALTNLESQAQNLESKTGFMGQTADYDSIGTDALIALCPSEQKVLPAAEQTQLRQIAHDLGGS